MRQIEEFGKLTALDIQKQFGLTLEESNRIVEQVAKRMGANVEMGIALRKFSGTQ